MKTAESYLDAQLRGPERPQFVSYAEALAAVQAALDEAGTVGQQLTHALNSYFDNVLPEPALPPLPVNDPPIRLGACRKCGEARRLCLNRECPGTYSNRFGEEPPF